MGKRKGKQKESNFFWCIRPNEINYSQYIWNRHHYCLPVNLGLWRKAYRDGMIFESSFVLCYHIVIIVFNLFVKLCSIIDNIWLKITSRKITSQRDSIKTIQWKRFDGTMQNILFSLFIRGKYWKISVINKFALFNLFLQENNYSVLLNVVSNNKEIKKYNGFNFCISVIFNFKVIHRCCHDKSGLMIT